ncbi:MULTISPECIES: PilW family protein [Pseudomonas]|uniref:PilW family protein n=1 Tax=Pseudomonas TaxID=286 RepID=UPI00249CC5BE|nr:MULTISPECIES: PilW family protein [Pseudomonas]
MSHEDAEMRGHGQDGLSLVELMVALAISSFLILGVTQIYLDNKRNYLFQQGQSENQENGRFTLQLLEQQLAKAGFRRRPDDQLDFAFPAVTASQTGITDCAFAAGEVVKSVNAKTLCIRYQPRDTAEVDCLGNGRSANNAAIAQPYTSPVENFVEKIGVNDSGQLICTSKNASGETSGVLVDGITDIRFDYGVNTTEDREVTSFKVTPAGGDFIRVVRYSALMSTSQGNISQDVQFKTYKEWYGEDATAPNDGKIYQIAKSTMTLRNQMP